MVIGCILLFSVVLNIQTSNISLNQTKGLLLPREKGTQFTQYFKNISDIESGNLAQLLVKR